MPFKAAVRHAVRLQLVRRVFDRDDRRGDTVEVELLRIQIKAVRGSRFLVRIHRLFVLHLAYRLLGRCVFDRLAERLGELELPDHLLFFLVVVAELLT